MIEHDIAIGAVGALLIYADLGAYYVINGKVGGYLGSWKKYFKELLT